MHGRTDTCNLNSSVSITGRASGCVSSILDPENSSEMGSYKYKWEVIIKYVRHQVPLHSRSQPAYIAGYKVWSDMC